MFRNQATPSRRLRRFACMPRQLARPPARQGGTSLIEFSIVAVPVLLLGLGSIEAAQWFFTRQAVSLALLEAGRAAITAHARPTVIEDAFEKALLPLFPAASEHSGAQRLHSALDQRRRVTGAAPWRIEILSPDSQSFIDFSDPLLPIAQETGLSAINNNYLAEQSQRITAQGRSSGLGPASGRNIMQANTLVLRLTYLHEPVVPGIKGLLRFMGSQRASYGQNAMALGGYLPLVQDIALVMQSHPVDWPSLANGKVVKNQLPPKDPYTTYANCHGLWCIDTPSIPGSAGPLPDWPPIAGGPPNTPDTPAAGPPQGDAAAADAAAADAAAADPPPGTTAPDLAVGPDDPACGVILCCTV